MPDVEELDFLQGGVGASPGYSARQLRKPFVDTVGEGVYDNSSFRVSFSAGMTVNVAPGMAYLRGSSNVDQGMYRAYQSVAGGNLPVTLAAANVTLPRIDRIVLQVLDSTEDAQGSNKAVVDKITGTATAAADLDNLNGAASLTGLASPTLIHLADVLVNPNNTPALSNTFIRDRRAYAIRGTIPAISTNIDMVAMEPVSTIVRGRFNYTGANYASRQAAALFYLPRRIPATHIRWRYQQDASVVVGTGQNYRFAIADASGRFIAQVASTAFGGAANNYRNEIVPFNPALPAGTIFEAGAYYVFFALSALSGTQAFSTVAVVSDSVGQSNGNIVITPNTFYRNDTGGVTLPGNNTILSMTDAYSEAGGHTNLPVPLIALSVG